MKGFTQSIDSDVAIGWVKRKSANNLDKTADTTPIYDLIDRAETG